MRGSAMKPHLTTSPRPATSSSRGSVSSRRRSHSTPAGSWKAPTRFLPAPVLMPGLAAHRGVDHAEHGGRHVHDPDAAQPGGGHEAAEVGGGAAAQRHHRVGAGEAGLAERLPAVGGDLDRLGRLAVGETERQDVVVRRQRVGHRLGQGAELAGVEQRDPLDLVAEDLPAAGRPGRVPTTTSYGEAPPTCRTVSSGVAVMREPPGSPRRPPRACARRCRRSRSATARRRGPLVEQGLDLGADVAQQQRPADAEARPA